MGILFQIPMNFFVLTIINGENGEIEVYVYFHISSYLILMSLSFQL